MFKYALSFFACCLVMTAFSAFMFNAGVPLLAAIFVVLLANCIFLYGWRTVVDAYDLEDKDNKLMDSISVEKEKLMTVHEYRRLHEVDYAEFSENVRATYLNNKNPQAHY